MSSGSQNHNELRRIGHTIVDPKFGNRLAPASWMDCSCGTHLAAPDPLALEQAFRLHRREVGARYINLSDRS